MATPIRIQLAIQGGGAKIIGLVAAMEIVQAKQRKGEIEITRLAGASAGAIVAALFSAGVDMGQLRVSLGTGELKKLFENYNKPGILEIAKQLIAGSPICDPQPIREFLRTLLAGVDKENVGHLQPKVLIVSANIALSSKHSHVPGEPLLEALMSSSAIPFVFRGWDSKKPAQTTHLGLKELWQKVSGLWMRQKDPVEAQLAADKREPLLVDGGICENLPIDELLKDEHEFGPIVAITFSTEKYYMPTDILGFGQAVLDTAIDNSVHRARSLLPTFAIFEIGQWFPISTFDFAEAIKAAGTVTKPGEPYLNVKGKALQFFERYIQRRRDGNPATSYDPWDSTNTAMRKILEANWQVCSSFCRTKMRYDQVRMVATLFGNEKEADRLVVTCRFFVLEEPMMAIRLSIMNTIGNDYLGRTSWTLHSVAEPEKEIAATAVPIRNPSDPKDRWIALYFDNPLPANSGPYELEIIDFADVILDELESKKTDTLQFSVIRSTGIASAIELVVVYHNKIRLTSEVEPEYRHLSAQAITTRQEKDRFRGNLQHDRFDVTGLRLMNVPDAKAGILIHLQT